MFIRFENYLLPKEKILCARIVKEKTCSYIMVDLAEGKYASSERKNFEETEKIFQKLLDNLNKQ